MINRIKKLTRRSLVILYITAALFVIEPPAVAQDVFLHDTTIATAVTYMSNSVITLGPNLTVNSSGFITAHARERIALMPGVYILGGGQIQALTGVVSAIETDKEVALPADFKVYQNYPNPFNPSTSVRYYLPSAEDITADIFTIYGEKVTTLFSGRQPAGSHSLVWNGTSQSGQKMSSGMYYLRINAGHYRAVIKMTLLK